MSVLSCNGAAVLAARITMPRAGAWTADLVVDTRTAPTGKIVLKSHDDKLHLVGTVVRGGLTSDAAHLRIIGGAGGLDRDVPAQAYRTMPVRTPLRDVLAAAGEALATTSDARVLDTVLPAWTRRASAARDALGALADETGASWRVLPDGTVWFGRETWPPAAAFACDVLEEHPEHGHLVLGIESHALLPGTTFRDRRVSLVVHVLDEAGVRSEVWFEREAEESRLLGGLRRLLARLLWRIDYLALYPSKVVAQNGDGTLELKPDSDRLPGLSRVPLRAGLPGVKVKVSGGARVLVGFEGGDPARPIATVWEEPGLTELQIGGARPVARQGDSVTLTMPPVVPLMGTINGSQPFVGTMTIPTPLVGTIITGSGSLKA